MTELKIGSGESPRAGSVCLLQARLSLKALFIALVTVSLLAVPSASFADEATGRAAVTGKESGLGAAAALSSLVYGPLKLAYATGGVLVGAFAWAFTAGDTEVADKVFTRALRGNYVITPDILTGKEPLYFIGRDEEVEPSMARPEAIASAPTTYTTVEPYTGTTSYSTSADSAVSGAAGVIEDSSTITTTETWERPATYDDMGW